VSPFVEIVTDHINQGSLVRLTLSKTKLKSADLKNVYVRPVLIKNQPHFSFTYRYQTRDVVKNFLAEQCQKEIDQLASQFLNALLITTQEEITLQTSKKGVPHVSRKKATPASTVDYSHDRTKKVYSNLSDVYLQHLSITDQRGKLIPRMADKYRQINKYLEIIDHLIHPVPWPHAFHIVDMGSGKGYLTFSLYHYLVNTLGLDAKITGVELREDLVNHGNKVAKQCHYDNLHFVQSSIQDYQAPRIDMLIALHACDTATDDAIAKGIKLGASIIVCAPCCHKQIRQQVKGKVYDNPLLKYGIYKERQFEMVTDTLRALMLETKGYKTNLFEFISSEHTSKNIMLTAVKSDVSVDVAGIQKKIDNLKKEFQIEYHQLERLLL